MQHNKRIYITTNDSDREGKHLAFTFGLISSRIATGRRERGGVKLDLGEPSWRARDTRRRRGDREGGGIVEESDGDADSSTRSRERERGGIVEESDRDVDSSTRSRERKRERGGIVEESEGDADSSTREREATIPPIETPTDVVDKEISSWRRDHHFAFGTSSFIAWDRLEVGVFKVTELSSPSVRRDI
ncbi:hypothetical protein F2Q69_00004438 [Brassica cretica]|uniref:Uncharacterized protein n=1 Tax=Brassica cretica TaxID=69181 RepID=A0A8S9P837_BRACR|nr:hypothetical protein F2Q69_00004438 [Brassica cretica]